MPDRLRRSRSVADARLTRDYELLDLEPGATPDEIERAHREAALVWHPDRFPHNPRLQAKATKRLAEINQAYDRLRRASRSTSDSASVHPGANPAQAGAKPDPGPPSSPRHTPRASTTGPAVRGTKSQAVWIAVVVSLAMFLLPRLGTQPSKV